MSLSRAALGLLVLTAWLSPAASWAQDGGTETPEEAAKRVTEITLVRSGGGGGPEDALTLKSDGTALYVGTKNVARVGRYRGSVPEHGFADNFPLLAQLYTDLRGRPHSTGKPTGGRVTAVTIRVVWDGKPEEIEDLCPGMDRRLWALEAAARGVAADIAWERDEPMK